MDWQGLAIAAVSALSGAFGKEAATHVVQKFSPTARMKRAEALAKATAPPPPAPPPHFLIPDSLVLQSKHVELVQLRDELSSAQDALRRLRRENEELSLGRAQAVALTAELNAAQAELRRLRETCDGNALELAKMSAELQLSRAHNLKLLADAEELRTQGPQVRQRPEKVLPAFRVERIRTRGGASATPQISEKLKGEGKTNG